MAKAEQAEPVAANIRTRLASRTEVAFANEERSGLMLAAKVRIIALLLILAWQIIDNPESGAAFAYELAVVSAFALLGLLHYISARSNVSAPQLKYIFVLVDCLLLAFFMATPNPFSTMVLPPAIALDNSRAGFFYIFLMQAAFSLRPWFVLWTGLCIVAAQSAMLAWFVVQPGVYTNFSLAEQTLDALLAARPDTNFIYLGFWLAQTIVTLILAAGLAAVVARSRRLVDSRTVAERTRASLARYFSPNVVDHLGNSGELLGTVRQQNAAVLFVDIVGFTRLCENSSAETVIGLLRQYHDRLGKAVFDNAGTLDKYIGDGLMATFGTPRPGPQDAQNALQCALDMIDALAQWNSERILEGNAPVHIGIGIDFGPVVAGDVGNERRLEYTVIGDTVNTASRLEQLARQLDTPLVVSDNLVQAIFQHNGDDPLPAKLSKASEQEVRGKKSKIAVWTYPAALATDTVR